MLNSVDTSAVDPRQLESLKNQATKDPKKAIPEAARQFEQVFVQQVMKSMRTSSLGGGGTMDSEASKTFTSMLDQQLSSAISKRSSQGGGLGLAPMIEKALNRTVSPADLTLSPGAIFPVNQAPKVFPVNQLKPTDGLH